MSDSALQARLRALAGRRAKFRRRPRVEDGALGESHRWRYSSFRLRFFFINQLLVLMLHWAELVLLERVFFIQELTALLLLKNFVLLSQTAWWGALEGLRAEGARFEREGDRRAFAGRMRAWFAMTNRLTAVACGASVVGLSCLIWSGANVEAVAVSAAFLLRLLLDLPIRARTAVIFSFRRVYRPAGWILGSEVVGFLLALALVPHYGAIGVAVVWVALSLLGAIIAAVYNRRAWRALRLPQPARRPISLHVQQRKNVVIDAASLAASRIGNLMVLASYSQPDFMIFAHALSPLVGAASGWVQVFFFDLRRGVLEAVRGYRAQFVAHLERVAVALAGILWVTSWPALLWFEDRLLGRFTLRVALFFGLFLLVQSRVSLKWSELFTGGRRLSLPLAASAGLGVFGLGSFLSSRLVPVVTGRWGEIEVHLFLYLFALLTSAGVAVLLDTWSRRKAMQRETSSLRLAVTLPPAKRFRQLLAGMVADAQAQLVREGVGNRYFVYADEKTLRQMRSALIERTGGTVKSVRLETAPDHECPQDGMSWNQGRLRDHGYSRGWSAEQGLVVPSGVESPSPEDAVSAMRDAHRSTQLGRGRSKVWKLEILAPAGELNAFVVAEKTAPVSRGIFAPEVP